MNPVIIVVGGIAAYMMFSKGNAQINMGAKPRTNVFSNGKDYAMNRDNYDISMGYVPTRAIGKLGTPKQLVFDRAGVMHEHHFVSPALSKCNCRHDGPH